jgi:hypothetical protein
MTNKCYWEFSIVKWDETGNILLERHHMIVQRQAQCNAVTAIRKKYSPKDGYFEELNSSWMQFPDGTTNRYVRSPDGLSVIPHETHFINHL